MRITKTTLAVLLPFAAEAINLNMEPVEAKDEKLFNVFLTYADEPKITEVAYHDLMRALGYDEQSITDEKINEIFAKKADADRNGKKITFNDFKLLTNGKTIDKKPAKKNEKEEVPDSEKGTKEDEKDKKEDEIVPEESKEERAERLLNEIFNHFDKNGNGLIDNTEEEYIELLKALPGEYAYTAEMIGQYQVNNPKHFDAMYKFADKQSRKNDGRMMDLWDFIEFIEH